VLTTSRECFVSKVRRRARIGSVPPAVAGGYVVDRLHRLLVTFGAFAILKRNEAVCTRNIGGDCCVVVLLSGRRTTTHAVSCFESASDRRTEWVVCCERRWKCIRPA